MPHTIIYRPFLIDELITNSRLGSYQSVFKTTSDTELVGTYLWNAHACSAIHPLLSSAEITLRNAIDSALTAGISQFWWKKGTLRYKSFVPTPPGSPPVKAPQIVTDIVSSFDKAANTVIKDKKERYGLSSVTPGHHEIVSKTDFSVWEKILDQEFLGPGLIWPTYLGKVFRGPLPSTKLSVALSSIKDMVFVVRGFRNRISHHEPAWKRHGVKTPDDAIDHLREKIKKIVELIQIISPEKLKLLTRSGVIDRAYSACTLEEISRFQHNTPTYNVRSISKLSRIAEDAANRNVVQKISIYGKKRHYFILQPT